MDSTIPKLRLDHLSQVDQHTSTLRWAVLYLVHWSMWLDIEYLGKVSRRCGCLERSRFETFPLDADHDHTRPTHSVRSDTAASDGTVAQRVSRSRSRSFRSWSWVHPTILLEISTGALVEVVVKGYKKNVGRHDVSTSNTSLHLFASSDCPHASPPA